MRLIVQTYEQSRLEFFEELKKHHERKLHWWKHQKPYKKGLAHCDPMKINEKCSYHGAAIQYCEDAIKALQIPVFHMDVNKVCIVNGAPCNECVPGAPCAKMYGGAS
jgi:hypothetical protein